MISRQKHPDKKNAASIIEASARQMRYTLTLESNDISAFNIIRNVYECFRMLGDALLVTQGIESEDHLAPIHELMKLKVDTPPIHNADRPSAKDETQHKLLRVYPKPSRGR